MKHFQKRMLAIVLALLMVLSVIPVTVLSAAADEVDNSTALFKIYAVDYTTIYNNTHKGLANSIQYGYQVSLRESGTLLKINDSDEDESTYKLSQILANYDALKVKASQISGITTPFLVFALAGNDRGVYTLEGNYDIPMLSAILIPNDASDTYCFLNPIDLTMEQMMANGIMGSPVGDTEQQQLLSVMTGLKNSTHAYNTLQYSGGKMTFHALSQMSVAGYYYAGDLLSQQFEYFYQMGMPANAVFGPYGKVELANGATLEFTAEPTGNDSIPSVPSVTKTVSVQEPIKDEETGEYSASNPVDYTVPAFSTGSYLGAWGFITGAGNVNVLNGANVYEDFQLNDFPGKDSLGKMITMNIGNASIEGVFPVSQYYVQNVESELNIYLGGIENIHACLAAGKSSGVPNLVPIEVPFVGVHPANPYDEQPMFELSASEQYPNPYITKEFVNVNGEWKTTFSIHGNAAIANLQMPLYHLYTIDSTTMQLPISNIDIVVEEGTLSTNQDLLLLPYSSIQVGEDATLELNSCLYVVDEPQEGEDRAYPGTRDVTLWTNSDGFIPDSNNGYQPATRPVSADGVDSGAQLVIDGTVIINPSADEVAHIVDGDVCVNYPNSGIAYVGYENKEPVVGDGKIINYSNDTVPQMTVMPIPVEGEENRFTSEEVTPEQVLDENGDPIVNDPNSADPPQAFKYSDEYEMWYPDGEDNITIVFDPDNGDTPITANYSFNETVTVPGDPTKDEDEQYADYRFSSWTSSNPDAEKKGNAPGAAGGLKAIANTTYTAHYTGTLQVYTVTFYDGEGELIDEIPFNYGDPVEFPEDSLPVPEDKTLMFLYWCDDESGDTYDNDGLSDVIVKGDMVFYAEYGHKMFTIQWLDENNDPINVGSGNNVVAGLPPYPYILQVEANEANYSDEYYDYKVIGWNYSYTDCRNDKEVTGKIYLDDDRYTTPALYGDTVCTPIYTRTPKEDPFVGEDLTLKGEIGVNTYVQLPAGDSSDYSIRYRWGVGAKAQSFTDNSLVSTPNGYKATLDISPKEIMDTITIDLMQGNDVIATDTYHAADYAVRVVLDEDKDNNGTGDITEWLKSGANPLTDDQIAALKSLCESLLWYGKKAQEQFKYTPTDSDLSAQVDEILSSHTLSYNAEDVTVFNTAHEPSYSAVGLKDYAGATMTLLSNTTFTLYFEVTDKALADSIETITATIGDKPVTVEKGYVDAVSNEEDAFLYIDLKDIPAKSVTDQITVSIGNNISFVISTGSYIKSALATDASVPAYATLQDTVRALYDYNQKAKAFFTA